MTSRSSFIRPFRECSRRDLRPHLLTSTSRALLALCVLGFAPGCVRTLDCIPVVDSVNDGIVAIEWHAGRLTLHNQQFIGSTPLVEGRPITGVKIDTCLIRRKKQIRALHDRLVEGGDWQFLEEAKPQ